MLCEKKNDSHKFFNKIVLSFFFLFFVIGCNYQSFCFLYFDSQHGVRLCINKNDEIVSIDCLHIDNESILSKKWVGSFILEGSLCAIFGRNWDTKTNLADDKDACIFDRVSYPRGDGRLLINNRMFCIRVAYKRIIPEKITLYIQFDSPVSQYVFDHNCEVLKNFSTFWLVSDEDISFDLLELSNIPKEAIQFSFVFNALVYENDSNSSSIEPLIVSQTCSCSSTIEEGFDKIEKTYYWRSGPIKDLEYIS